MHHTLMHQEDGSGCAAGKMIDVDDDVEHRLYEHSTGLDDLDVSGGSKQRQRSRGS